MRYQIGIIYASTIRDPANAQDSLKHATELALGVGSSDTERAKVLWSMAYTVDEPLATTPDSNELSCDTTGQILQLPDRRHDVAFDDSILDSIKVAWEKILGERSAEYDFLRFEERADPNAED